MSDPAPAPGSQDIVAHYGLGIEQPRLGRGSGQLELLRTQETILRYLPPPPAVILDVGGGPGGYSCWLAKLGYEVHLLDLVPLHVEQALAASRAQPEHPLASVSLGDARQLPGSDASVDAVLLLGPLYHLTERDDRLAALREARRVVRGRGLVFAVGVSRFASALDGLFRGYVEDPEFVRIMEQDLRNGQHRNPTGKAHYWTTAYLHHPSELAAEVEHAGLEREGMVGLEGPAWLLPDFEEHWRDPDRREHLLRVVRAVGSDPSAVGISAHVLMVGRKPE
jgi:ubiquinone/menaquinone biosynthesis C-methylase UbiE